MCIIEPNFMQISRTFAEIWLFFNFNFKIFYCPYALGGHCFSSSQILCRLVKLLRRFRFFKTAAVRHLGFLKLETLTAHTLTRAKMHQYAKFCTDRSNRCGDMAVFNFSRWRPSAILDLLYACLDNPQSAFWWSLSLCNIWFESV